MTLFTQRNAVGDIEPQVGKFRPPFYVVCLEPPAHLSAFLTRKCVPFENSISPYPTFCGIARTFYHGQAPFPPMVIWSRDVWEWVGEGRRTALSYKFKVPAQFVANPFRPAHTATEYSLSTSVMFKGFSAPFTQRGSSSSSSTYLMMPAFGVAYLLSVFVEFGEAFSAPTCTGSELHAASKIGIKSWLCNKNLQINVDSN